MAGTMGLDGVVPLLCCSLALATVFAQDASHSSLQSGPFITQMKKTVVFIQTECKASPRNEIHSGTGFFVWLPEPRLGDKGFTYLVTNRHVAQPGIENGKPCDTAARSVRLNLKPGTDQSALSRLERLDAGAQWVFPSDDGVDLAVLPLNPDMSKYDYQAVSTNIFADQKSDGFIEGDAVLFAGLFVQYAGRAKIQPIVRSGSLAMIPDETMPTTLKKPGRFYLAEVHAFGGNSGSPMFVDVAGLRKNKLGYDFRLLGVVAGEVFETASFELQVNASFKGDVAANSGISVVVPAAELKTLLDSSVLKKQRDELVAKETRKAP